MKKEVLLSELKDKNPIVLLEEWFKEAKEHPDVKQAEAMVLSTTTWGGRVVAGSHRGGTSSRVVLLKEITPEGLIFYTNYKSLKGFQILWARYLDVALNFYWPVLDKQIRVQGQIRKTNKGKSLAYWKTRSFESQVSQYISQQSKPLESRVLLEQKWQAVRKQYYGQAVPCPRHWGGFVVKPHIIEFWQEKPHRLHDRLLFIRKRAFWMRKSHWVSTLLYP